MYSIPGKTSSTTVLPQTNSRLLLVYGCYLFTHQYREAPVFGSGTRSVGSVINWPLGPGRIFTVYQRFKEMSQKVKYFTILNDLLRQKMSM
jgi:hypothetical protein